MKPPRVLFVSHSADLFGAEISLLELAAALKKRSLAEPHVLLPGKGLLSEALAAAGIPFTMGRYKRWIHEKGNFSAAAHFLINAVSLPLLARKIKKLEPELVYSNTLAAPAGAVIAFLLKRPHIWHIREFIEEDFGCRFDLGRRLSLGIVRNSSNRILCNSQAVFRKWIAFLKETQTEVLPHSVPLERITPHEFPENAAAGPLKLAVIGTIQPAKGQEEAVRALAILKTRGKNARLKLIGKTADEAYRRRVQETAAASGVSDAVEWCGGSSAPFSVLESGSILLVPSRCEAFGRTVLEAMRSGVPVIAADSGGLPELIDHGETGRLYQAGNAEDLSRNILELAKDFSSLYALIERARRGAAERRDFNSYVSRAGKILSECLSAGGNSPSRGE